ncbi:class A beta-lactamase [Nocardiopsis kunsanensis]|uniref:Beta-lactamase n=1 Tax=Nocardiopsis kunsanensis TaxID=141693 RepID=A0A918X9U9_9ACTN|nr:class A beta-lactamase [Nocardiopsis kunsanensis]GHD20120.1 beta-lactamase [Nocardiopsis kunsanensis]
MSVRTLTRPTAALAATLVLVPLSGCGTGQAAPVSSPSSSPSTGAEEAFTGLEEDYDARLGVYALDTGTGQEVEYGADDRFAYASTFKALAVGALLDQHGAEVLDERMDLSEEDLLTHAPIAEEFLDQERTDMTLREASDAAVRYSDNTAANLVLERLGGPEGYQEALREIGDDTTSADRWEEELNEAAPGDERDTSTPRAMAENLRTYVLEEEPLAEDEREFLTDLLVRNTTGDALIRAGVPEDWEVGDKTGGGGYATRNDIAVAWPPESDPVVIAVMSSRGEQDAEYDDALVAEATETAVEALD